MKAILSAFLALLLSAPAHAWVDVHVRGDLGASDIWADAPDNIWVAHAIGFLHHYDGVAWTHIPTVGEHPQAIWGHGGLIYLAGDRYVSFYNPSSGNFTPIGTPPNVDFEAIVAFGIDRVMVGGISGVWLWRGVQWDQVSMRVDPGIVDLWGTGPLNVYGAAETGHLHQYTADGSDGAAGSFDDIFNGTFDDPLSTSDDLLRVWGTGPSDVYVATDRGAVAHYDGSAAPNGWTAVTGAVSTSIYDVHGTIGSKLVAVTGTAAVGAIGFHQFNGTAWEPMTGDISPPGSVRAVWVFSDTDVFAVADGSAFHYDGNYVRMLPGSHFMGLRKVWSYGDNGLRFVAVGDRGNILTNRNGSVEVAVSDSFVDLNAVWGFSKDHIWAAGDGGLVRHFNGTNWSTVDAGTTADLRGVWGWAENQLIICGDASTLRQYNGSIWTDVTLPTSGYPLTAIDGVDADNYFVGTTSGRVFHMNAGTMEETAVGSTSDGTHFIKMFTADTAVLAHGDGVARWTGNSFTLDADYPLMRSAAITGEDPANLVAVSYNGTGGTIHRFANGVWSEDWTPVWGDGFSGASTVGGETVVVGDSYVLVDAINRLVVNSNDDTDDGNCDTSHCSLREAIDTSNGTPGRDLIAFDIAGANRRIELDSELPPLTEEVIIDGATQPGFADQPVITLDGLNLAVVGNGLTCAAVGNTAIRSLAIVRFPEAGIAAATCDNLTLTGNIIGLEADGTTPASNDIGVDIVNSSSVTVGGSTVVGRNIISGNVTAQVQTDSGNNTIAMNFIGVDITGDVVDFGGNPPAGTRGVRVTNAGATHITDNVISGNETGIELICATGARIYSNFIGIDAVGLIPIPGSGTGISVTGSDVEIGVAGRNIISGNHWDGILFPVDVCSMTSRTPHQVLSNIIGLGPNGELLGNGLLGGAGIHIDGGNDVHIGTSNEADRNEIVNNTGGGIVVTAGQGNTIGVNYIHDNDGVEVDIGGDGRDNVGCSSRDFEHCADSACVVAEIAECTENHDHANTAAPVPFVASVAAVAAKAAVFEEGHDLGGATRSSESLFLTHCADGVWHIDFYLANDDDADPGMSEYFNRYSVTRNCSLSSLELRSIVLPVPPIVGPSWVIVNVTAPDGSTSEFSNRWYLADSDGDSSIESDRKGDSGGICDDCNASGSVSAPLLLVVWVLVSRRRRSRAS